MAKRIIGNHRTMHIDLREEFIHTHVENNQIKIQYIPSEDNPADILTKGLPHQAHARHCDTLMGTSNEKQFLKSKELV
jgi:hypothetical protein